MNKIKMRIIFINIMSLSILIAALSQCAYSQSKTIKTDWVFIYYMPYDNNLHEYGEKIISMIRDSISSEKVMATIQADFNDKSGMTRYLITKDTILTYHVNNEYSASTKTYEEYLAWVENKINYNKKAVVILDHGGKLDEVGLDQYPEFKFLKVDSLSSVYKNIYKQKQIDLLFLQVCTKASIEPVYEFKDVARFTLCSQLTLGAPNYYYHTLFSKLSQPSDLTGDVVAKIIMDSETEDMYNSYTLIDNSKLDTFREMFSDFINSSAIQNKIKLSAQPLNSYYYYEKYWDIISFIENIYVNEQQSQIEKKNKLIDFIKTKLLIVKLNPIVDEVKGTCGLSIFARGASDNIKTYTNLEFNKQFFDFPKVVLAE